MHDEKLAGNAVMERKFEFNSGVCYMSYFDSRCQAETKDAFEHSDDRTSILVATVKDIVTARQCGRERASKYGFSSTDVTLVTTIIAELARNILLYAQKGRIILENTAGKDGSGIVIISQDDGPGIADVERALMGGYSTSGGLGLGLRGVRRMADKFHIDTGPTGTTIMVEKKTLVLHMPPLADLPVTDRKELYDTLPETHVAPLREARGIGRPSRIPA